VYFAAISVTSATIQLLLRRRIDDLGLTYEQARIAISGAAFGLAYVLHRRYSFADFKKVGVAVYANGVEDIKAIHARIENVADIIHVDIVDRSYGRPGQDVRDVRTYRLEAVRAYWPRKPIHVHVMSRTPSRYLDELYPFVDRIYVHSDADEDVGAALAAIRGAGKEAGIALSMDRPLDEIRPYLEAVNGVLFLAIAEPGKSGQSFQMEALERLASFSAWPERARLDVCVDGGVTEANVGLLNVEIVVSGSSVLAHADPRRQIMRLQTSSSYEQT
jgi:ribulose-phosphate 3-epimerase